MTSTKLLYDASCKVCRELAHKVRFYAKRPVEIVALSDPEAKAILAKRFPDGAPFDFYLVDGKKVVRGLGAVPRLTRLVGAKRFASLVGEYVALQRAKAKCQIDTAKAQRAAGHEGHDHGHEHPSPLAAQGISRRKLLGYAVVAPVVMAPLVNLPRLDSPLEKRPTEAFGSFEVNVAVVRSDGAGGFTSEVLSGAPAILQTGRFDSEEKMPKILSKEQALLGTTTLPDGGKVRFNHTQSRMGLPEYPDDKAVSIDVYETLVDQERYSLSVSVGRGPVEIGEGVAYAVSSSAMVKHDLALPVVDYVIYRPVQGDAPITPVEAQVVGLRALAEHHERNGQAKLGALYSDIADGHAVTARELAPHLPAEFVQFTNTMTVTSMPESMKFLDPSKIKEIAGVSLTEGSCGCSCSCDCCCGCGCGCACGFCGCLCICDCCCQCGCGCGCGCCAGGGAVQKAALDQWVDPPTLPLTA